MFERHSETELGTVDDIHCVRDVRHLLVLNRFHTQTKREHGDFLTWHSRNAENMLGSNNNHRYRGKDIFGLNREQQRSGTNRHTDLQNDISIRMIIYVPLQKISAFFS